MATNINMGNLNTVVELFIEEHLIDDADFMALYHKLEHGSDDTLDIKACIWPIIYPIITSPIEFSVEYTIAYLKYRMFIVVCAQLVIDKLGSTYTKAGLADLIVKDVDSNLWSTFDKDFSKAHYADTYFGFRNYKAKITTITLVFKPLEAGDSEFFYKLPLLDHKVHLIRYDVHGKRDLGLISIKDITKSNITTWARGK